ncbi:ABC transporter permease [Paenibacillus yanchengensis]|uniref:ABC transporter permease n=1 Tax=Paenibacillus yanchengensis TaxID=2035833 RepID=A0ABW4YF50_9BACL
MLLRWIRLVWLPFVVVLLTLIAWQLYVDWSGMKKHILPSPLDVLHTVVTSFPMMWPHITATMYIAITGYLLSIGVGLFVAIALHLISPLRKALYPLLLISQNIPMLTIGPILVIWFGFGILPKIILIVLMLFFPVTIAMMGGLMQVDRKLLEYMRMVGATKWQIFWKLELPSALPQMFSGLKISTTYSVMGAVISDYLGTEKGLGQYMKMGLASYRADRIFAAIIVIVIVSLSLYGVVALAGRWFTRWDRDKHMTQDT